MGNDNPTIDKAAAAIARTDVLDPMEWHELSAYGKDCYRKQAQAALDALGLTEEWAVQYRHEDYGQTQKPASSREGAAELGERITKRFWVKYANVAGAGTIAPNPVVVSRQVSAWVSGGTETAGDTE